MRFLYRCSRLLLLCAGSPLSAQSSATGIAADPRVDSVFADYDKPNSPGCAVGVYRDDRMVYTRGYGLADLERQVPITSRTVFDIGSTSKQFTAAVIVLLAQEGKLSLDDDVRKHIAELPAYERPITIRQLLNHTSGLRDYIGLLLLSGRRFDDVTTSDDALRLLTQQRALNFTPGAEHLYSNSGYFLLSLIVERVTGKSLREEAQSRIFTPLGMRSSQLLGGYDEVLPNRALAYERRGGGYRHDLPRWMQLGDGAVFTTVEDLLRWDQNFYTPAVGGRAMVDSMLVCGRLNDGKELDYALGLIHERFRGQRAVSHGGAWGGYRAELLRFPEQHYSVAVLCNLASSDPSALARGVAAVHLGAVLEPVAKSVASAPATSGAASASPAMVVPEATLRRYVGTYRQVGGSNLATLVVADGQLRVTVPGAFTLRADSDREFTVIGAPFSARLRLELPTGDTAPATRLTWQFPNQPDMVFARVDAESMGAVNLVEFAGTYRSEELDGVLWRLTASNGALVASFPGDEGMSLRAIGRDEFGGGGTTMRFVRNATGAVVEAFLSQGRMRNIRFNRVDGSTSR